MEIVHLLFTRPRFRSEVSMKTLSEKELDFLYWTLVDYCETNIPQELPECANINRIFKQIVKLNDKIKEAI